MLEAAQHFQQGNTFKTLKPDDYKNALCYAVELEDESIIQALLESKYELGWKMSIGDWSRVMQHAFLENKENGLKILLKCGLDANQDLVQDAIGKGVEKNIIKILLDPRYNPQVAALKIQNLLEYAIMQAMNQGDGEEKVKTTFFALLDPIINPQVNILTINQNIFYHVIASSKGDIVKGEILQKILESIPTISLTDGEIKSIILFTLKPYNESPTLRILLENLIKKYGKSYIKKLIPQKNPTESAIVDTKSSWSAHDRQIFIDLGILKD